MHLWEVKRVQGGHEGGALVMVSVPSGDKRPESGSLCAHTQRTGHVSTQPEAGCPQARKTALTGAQPGGNLVLDFEPSQL